MLICYKCVIYFVEQNRENDNGNKYLIQTELGEFCCNACSNYPIPFENIFALTWGSSRVVVVELSLAVYPHPLSVGTSVSADTNINSAASVITLAFYEYRA
jgi:hypothetical protein